MKVGTDAVLLGTWMKVPDSGRMLDIGTGTGVISLIAAQRSLSAEITALEIDTPSANEAHFNFENSIWKNRLKVENISLQDYLKKCSSINEPPGFNLIFSNPPFYDNTLKNPSVRKSTARHTETLSHKEIIKAALSLLKPDCGRLAVILPSSEAKTFILDALTHPSLHLARLCRFRTSDGKPPKRCLIEIADYICEREESELIMNSSEYRLLTQGFYLSSY